MDRDELMKLNKSELITLLLSELSIIEQQSEQLKQISTKIAELEDRPNQNSRNNCGD
jgi:hypothetical protein